jgi:hypothetical protein
MPLVRTAAIGHAVRLSPFVSDDENIRKLRPAVKIFRGKILTAVPQLSYPEPSLDHALPVRTGPEPFARAKPAAPVAGGLI